MQSIFDCKYEGCPVLPRTVLGAGGGHCTTIAWDGMPDGNTRHEIRRGAQLLHVSNWEKNTIGI